MERFKNSIYRLSIILYFGGVLTATAQYKIPNKPKNQTSIYDEIGLLLPSEKNNLEQKLIRYSDTTSTQIVIAIVSSTKGEYINYLGAQWAEAWGIGQKNKDNGIFILLAKDDRKIGINTGKGIEHLLTDALSKRIINRDIIPYFKRNNFYGGLNNATDVIFEVLEGEYKNTPQNEIEIGVPISNIIFLAIIFIILIIAISKSRGNGSGKGKTFGKNSGSLLEAILLSNMGRGSYSKKSSSRGFGGGTFGGGFSGGFGGGSFGGGGASGGW